MNELIRIFVLFVSAALLLAILLFAIVRLRNVPQFVSGILNGILVFVAAWILTRIILVNVLPQLIDVSWFETSFEWFLYCALFGLIYAAAIVGYSTLFIRRQSRKAVDDKTYLLNVIG